jgi:isopentenyl-diphosphate delta-isomerase
VADHQEEWQVFNNNGEAEVGKSILPADSRKTNKMTVGAVHVWIWRQTKSGIEILLQKRADTMPTWPGYLDISAAGHIDVGESVLDAAVREAKEEIDLQIYSDNLLYIFGYRNFENGIEWVYLYEEITPQSYEFNDGEVKSLDWVKLQQFQEMIDSPETHNLVPHPPEYFSLLVKAVRYLNEGH